MCRRRLSPPLPPLPSLPFFDEFKKIICANLRHLRLTNLPLKRIFGNVIWAPCAWWRQHCGQP